MRIYDYIEVNLNNAEITPILEAVQGDTLRGVIIKVNDYTFENETARAFVKKADGHSVYNNATINVAKQEITVNYTLQMLAVAGKNELQIEIADGADRVSTFVITLIVKKSLSDNSAIESTDEYNALTELTANAQTAIDGANTAAGVATEAANNANAAAAEAATNAQIASEQSNLAHIAANNAQQQADRANTAAGGANAAAENAEAATTAANAAATNANNAVAGLATQKRIFNLTNFTLSQGVLAGQATFAKKTGNVVNFVITSVNNTNGYSDWEAIVPIQTAFNSLPLAWRKGAPRRLFIAGTLNGALPAYLYIQVNQTNYNADVVYLTGNNGGTYTGTYEWGFNGTWIVDD